MNQYQKQRLVYNAIAGAVLFAIGGVVYVVTNFREILAYLQALI